MSDERTDCCSARREFIRGSLGFALAAPCALMLSGCASLLTRTIEPVNGTQRLPLRLREFGQSVRQAHGLLVVLRLLAGGGLPGGQPAAQPGRGLVQGGVQGALAVHVTAAAVQGPVGVGQVAGQGAAEPGCPLRVGGAAEAVAVPVGLQQGLLHQVGGVQPRWGPTATRILSTSIHRSDCDGAYACT